MEVPFNGTYFENIWNNLIENKMEIPVADLNGSNSSKANLIANATESSRMLETALTADCSPTRRLLIHKL